MFTITATGNCGKSFKVSDVPFRCYKGSVAVKAGWGDRAQTIWLNVTAPERMANAVFFAQKGSRVTLVMKVTGASEDGKSLFGDLIEFELHGKEAAAAAPVGAADDSDEMPF